MKHYSKFAVLFLASFLCCSISFGQEKGEWDGVFKFTPALMFSEERNQIITDVAFGSRYFLTERLRADLSLQVEDGFSDNVSFSPGFRYYYRKDKNGWNLLGGLSLDVELLNVSGFERRSYFVATPVEAEIHLFKGLYLNVGLSYQKALDDSPFAENGLQSNLGFLIRF